MLSTHHIVLWLFVHMFVPMIFTDVIKYIDCYVSQSFTRETEPVGNIYIEFYDKEVTDTIMKTG